MTIKHFKFIFFFLSLILFKNINAQQGVEFNFPTLNKDFEKTVVSKTEFFNKEGQKINLTNFRDKIVILEFFLSWDIYESQSMHELGKLAKILEAQEVDDILVAPIFISSTSNFESAKNSAEKFMLESLVKLNTYFIDTKRSLHSEICNTKDNYKIPMSIIIDKSGKEVGRMEGSFSQELQTSKFLNKSKIISLIRENCS